MLCDPGLVSRRRLSDTRGAVHPPVVPEQRRAEEKTMRRTARSAKQAWAIILAAGALAVSGCGGDDSSVSGPSSHDAGNDHKTVDGAAGYAGGTVDGAAGGSVSDGATGGSAGGSLQDGSPDGASDG